MDPQTPTTSNVGTDQNTNNAAQIQQLYDMIVQLQAAQNQKAYKLDKPAMYDGTRGTIQGFLTQCRAYLLHYQVQFSTEAEKVLFAASRLEKDALAWFEPTMRDYLDNRNNPSAQKKDTQEIFAKYRKFEEALKGTFGDPDEERTAERKLMQLKQRGSASKYAAKFQQITTHLT